MSAAPLLLEIGCEEIPARMIPPAAAELARRVEQILDKAGLSHGATTAWGGSRRLMVRVEEVQQTQADREQRAFLGTNLEGERELGEDERGEQDSLPGAVGAVFPEAEAHREGQCGQESPEPDRRR